MKSDGTSANKLCCGCRIKTVLAVRTDVRFYAPDRELRKKFIDKAVNTLYSSDTVKKSDIDIFRLDFKGVQLIFFSEAIGGGRNTFKRLSVRISGNINILVSASVAERYGISANFTAAYSVYCLQTFCCA